MAKLEKSEQNIIWKDRKRTLFGLPWSFTKYRLTEDRLFIETGFFTSKEDEVRLYRIMDVSLTRTLGQKIFGLGSIQCCSADKTMGDFEIKSIKNSREVKEMLSQMIEGERSNKRVSTREYMQDQEHDFDDQDMNEVE